MLVAAENAFAVDILHLLRTHIDRIKFPGQSTEYQYCVKKLLFLPPGGQKWFVSAV